MDLLDIVIIAAAAVGVIAFITLAVVIVLQGRALKRLEERVGPPVPMGAAPSLERVRAIVSQPEVRVDIPADAAAAQRAPQGAPAAGTPSSSAPPAEVTPPAAAHAAPSSSPAAPPAPGLRVVDGEKDALDEAASGEDDAPPAEALADAARPTPADHLKGRAIDGTAPDGGA